MVEPGGQRQEPGGQAQRAPRRDSSAEEIWIDLAIRNGGFNET